MESTPRWGYTGYMQLVMNHKKQRETNDSEAQKCRKSKYLESIVEHVVNKSEESSRAAVSSSQLGRRLPGWNFSIVTFVQCYSDSPGDFVIQWACGTQSNC
jgi:hypothetical protein